VQEQRKAVIRLNKSDNLSNVLVGMKQNRGRPRPSGAANTAAIKMYKG